MAAAAPFIAPAIGIGGSLLGGGKGGAQQSQLNNQGSALQNQAAATLGQNTAEITSLFNGGMNGTGPLGALFNAANSASSGTTNAGNQLVGIGQGLENANLFPSAGASAMNTLLSRIGSVANPGAVIENTSAQLGQEGLAGNLAAKSTGANIIGAGGSLIGEGGNQLLSGLSSGLGSIAQMLSGGNQAANGLGNLATSSLNQASNMGSPWGSAISGITNGISGLSSAKGGAGGGLPAITGDPTGLGWG